MYFRTPCFTPSKTDFCTLSPSCTAAENLDIGETGKNNANGAVELIPVPPGLLSQRLLAHPLRQKQAGIPHRGRSANKNLLLDTFFGIDIVLLWSFSMTPRRARSIRRSTAWILSAPSSSGALREGLSCQRGPLTSPERPLLPCLMDLFGLPFTRCVVPQSASYQ